MTPLALPAGFRPHFRKSPATAPWEPLFSRVHAGGVDLLFEVRTPHCNGRGLLHGGVLSALCDNAMGLSLGTVLAQGAGEQAPTPQIVTVSLTVDFVAGATPGAWVHIAPRVLRAAKGVSFCDALVRRGDSPDVVLETTGAGAVVLARASASFRVKLGEAT